MQAKRSQACHLVGSGDIGESCHSWRIQYVLSGNQAGCTWAINQVTHLDDFSLDLLFVGGVTTISKQDWCWVG